MTPSREPRKDTFAWACALNFNQAWHTPEEHQKGHFCITDSLSASTSHAQPIFIFIFIFFLLFVTGEKITSLKNVLIVP